MANTMIDFRKVTDDEQPPLPPAEHRQLLEARAVEAQARLEPGGYLLALQGLAWLQREGVA